MEEELLSHNQLDNLNTLKQHFIKIINYFSRKYPITTDNNLNLANNLYEHNLTELFKLASIGIMYSKLFTDRTITSQLNYILTELPARVSGNIYASIHMGLGLFFAKIITAMSAQYAIIDPILNHLYPNGITAPALPQIKPLLSASEAKQLVTQLKQHEKELDRIAKRNIKKARIASLSIIPLAISLLMFNYKLSPELIILSLTLFATALQNLSKDLSDYYYEKSAKTRFYQFEALLLEILKDCKYKQESIYKGDLTASYFAITFKGKLYTNDNLLSGKAIANIFNNCCSLYRINIDFHRGNYLKISGNNKLDRNTAESINKFFTASIEREIKIRQLLYQLKKIASILDINNGTVIRLPEKDQNNLPTAEFLLDLTKNATSNILNKLQEAFKDYSIKANPSANNCQVSLKGFEPLPDSACHALLTELSNLSSINYQQQVNDSTLFNEEATPHKKGSQNTASKDKNDAHANSEENNEDSKITTHEARRIVKWRSGQYDSSQENNNIYPIPFGKVHNKLAYAKARFFVTNRLDYDKALQGLDENTKKEIANKIDELVPKTRFKAKKGEQGLTPWQSIELNQDGKKFETSAKQKILGNFGKIRLFTRSEIAPTGENLLCIEGIDLEHNATIKYL